ncbi:hypothetical protein SERLA73DRAFT_177236 [Serpula lacrymans var. lacrymans S7.3]|uniref:Uncharacterized protein n=2 Tax=Serpula lacrymans var. lacrymans TaxID=341189 RepID=F8PNM9_SERL3|nr:uncharacterized protein SERLADRAFT_460726 [Serpula lacrymans var. lacrymans S7.9]EGO01756.1 hypothetical protein SERLA73DRAFT_177236 [Serpula lacrymans var. lacrymans S7.3]EGO27393.1 hypothetical protein SERLADRAFT_460726 [Serpula lacrymans var. lacrymans S7.9]
MRHDIDALVERVRAVAMADHRPTTPGSHIDWAGDDDDSLPDLDDWGVTTASKSNAEKHEEISPILVDTLKPLPEPQLIEEAVPGKNTNESTSPGKTDGPSPLPPSPPSSLPTSSFEDDTGDILPTPKSKMSASSSDSGAVKALSDTGDGATAPPPRLPLHPSLPPKPVAAVETLKARSKPRGNHARPNLPQKPAPAATTVAEPVAEPVAAEPVVNSNDGLAQSIHAPTAAEVAQKEQQRLTEEQGLGASIHAPKGLADLNTANHSALGPTPSRVFNPSHNRSRTVGRPPSFQQPFTAPASLASGRVTRSGASSPLGPNGLTHARTHSSPPSSGPASRARPVITGDAISRLARTIGGAPRTVGVSAGAKE